jgi:hypothetical protein
VEEEEGADNEGDEEDEAGEDEVEEEDEDGSEEVKDDGQKTSTKKNIVHIFLRLIESTKCFFSS